MAKEGHKVALVERKYLGGACPNIACLPSKNIIYSIIYSAKVASLAKRGTEFGIQIPLKTDIATVQHRKRDMVAGLHQMHVERNAASGAKLIMGEGRFLDSRTVEIDLNSASCRLSFSSDAIKLMDVSLPESMLLARSRLVAARTIAASLIVAIVLGAGATMATAGQSASEPSLGSANDYVKNNPDFPDASEIPLLGIEVNNGADSLKDGHPVSGVEVLSAIPSGPGAAAGLQGRREGVQTALTVGILAGALFFPPAMLGMMALQQSGIGISRELIIAVDGQRTRDVTDFGEAIEKAEAGEVVYLTVLSHGQREQLRVELAGLPR